MFTVIIPTLWIKPKITEKLLNIYINSIYINEIIVISNDICPLKINNDKVILLEQSKNLYVNPSWNLGVLKSSNENLIISNDDILIPDNLLNYLNSLNLLNYGIIGINKESYVETKNIDNFENFSYDEHEIILSDQINYGFGVFMVLHKSKYCAIPENIKIYCGDNFLFYKNKNNATIKTKIKTEMSSTSGLLKFNSFKRSDKIEYKKIKKNL